MIVLEPAHLREIVSDCERAFPEEACGLLVGRTEGACAARAVHVAEVAKSANVAEDHRGERFEIDPALRLRLERTLRGTPRGVVGLYHSHPGGSAQASAADLERAWEPDLAWLIVSVLDGQAVQATANLIVNDAGGAYFAEVPLRTSNWRETGRGAPIEARGFDLPDPN